MIIKVSGILAAVLALIHCMNGSFFWLPCLFLGYFLAFFLAAVLFCVVACALVDMDKPVETESKFYRWLMYPFIELLINVFLVKISAKGLEKTPKSGRFLLVCNHQQFADPGIILNQFQKSQLTFISKQENRKIPVINKFMHCIRCQLIDRNNDRQALKAILECIRMIKADEVSVAVFPEGYTSKDGKLHPFRSGVFKIAQKTNVPIVVCTINGTRKLFTNFKKLRRTKVDLHLVDVIQPEQYENMKTNEISDLVYEKMLADLGENFRPEE